MPDKEKADKEVERMLVLHQHPSRDAYKWHMEETK